MKRINSLSDLLMEELSDLLSAEDQLVKALPKMVQVSQSSALRAVLGDHLEVAKDQADRLQDTFSNIGQEPSNRTCKSVQRFIADSEDLVNTTQEGPARDAALVGVMQRVINHEINGYQTACEHAIDLGHTMIVELLNRTLDEERTINLRLNELAQYMINVQVIDSKFPGQQPDQQKERPSESKGEGFYIPEGKFSRRGIVKKKNKNTDVSRFISEGNPNVQDKNLQNPEEQGDLS